MDTDTVRGRLLDVAAWFSASPAELVGLGMLLLGGVACAGVLLWWAPAQGATGPVASPGPVPAAPTAAPVTVHVAGAVLRPGLVELPAGARVADAIAAAGGAGPDADLGALNLAREVSDGERVGVPLAGAPGGEPAVGAATGTAVLPDGRVDLNAASAEELETLPGVGPVLAARIVSHRDEHGPFAVAGDLRAVPGIGERTFQRLAPLVTVR